MILADSILVSPYLFGRKEKNHLSNLLCLTLICLIANAKVNAEASCFLESSNPNNSAMTKHLTVNTITWNVHGEYPKCDFHELLGIVNYERENLPDIYAIGLQEVSIRVSSLLVGEPWTTCITDTLGRWDYVRVRQIRLQGILLLLYTKRELLTLFRSVETEFTRTGFGGLWGNKGGVSIRATIGGVQVCFTNCHLAPHDDQVEQRINDYNMILDEQRFKYIITPNILSHDYVFWMGDLNFRLEALTGDEIQSKVEEAEKSPNICRFEELLQYDELRKVMKSGKAFNELKEAQISFPPTYKFIANTDSYDYKYRRPAWTDRILYRFTPNSYDNFSLSLDQLNYNSYPQYKQSDHKPVSSTFRITIFKSRTVRSIHAVDGLNRNAPSLSSFPITVTFLPISSWQINTDSEAWYAVEPATEESINQLSQWDWIGLFRADFNSIDEPIVYVYANPTPSPLPAEQLELFYSSRRYSTDSTSSIDNSVLEDRPRTMSGKKDHTGPTPTIWFSVTFPDQSLLSANKNYRLIYVTQNLEVLGMSAPFEIEA